MKFQKAAFVLAGVNGRYYNQPSYVLETLGVSKTDEYEDQFYYTPERHPAEIIRVARQAISISTNPDGGVNLNIKAHLAGGDKNVLSALSSINGYHTGGPTQGQYDAVSGGFGLDNVNGHGLSVTGTHLHGLGDQLTGAGRVNLLNTNNHNLTANAFVTKTFSNTPNVPDFTRNRGGGLDYMYKNKIGASVGIAQTPLFQKTDYSAMVTLNLFRDRHSSLDFNAGANKSVSPFITKSSWQPIFGIGYTRFW